MSYDYLAMPWAKLSPEEAERALERSLDLARHLLASGRPVFHPIQQALGVVELRKRQGLLEFSHNQWLRQDFPFLQHADRLIILDDFYWGDSVGVHYEIGFMQGRSRDILLASYQGKVTPDKPWSFRTLDFNS